MARITGNSKINLKRQSVCNIAASLYFSTYGTDRYRFVHLRNLRALLYLETNPWKSTCLLKPTTLFKRENRNNLLRIYESNEIEAKRKPFLLESDLNSRTQIEINAIPTILYYIAAIRRISPSLFYFRLLFSIHYENIYTPVTYILKRSESSAATEWNSRPR